MKKRIGLFILLISLGSLALAQGFSRSKESVLGDILSQILENYHISKEKIDNTISKKAHKRFIKSLDYRKQFFLKEDISKLNQFKNKMDDQMRSGKLTALKTAYTLLEKRINEAKNYTEEFLKKPFDYSKNQFLETDPEKTQYASNSKEHKEYWRKLLKFNTINEIFSLEEMQKAELKVKKAKKNQKTKTKKVKEKTFAQLEKEARENVKNDYEAFFKRITERKEIDRLSTFFNSITTAYDPHTSYLPPMEVEDFNIDMRRSLEGIGAVLSQDGPYTKVERIVPGSPSWKGKELEESDIILKVGQALETPKSIVGMDLRDAVRLIRGKKGSEVRLTVKKADNSIKIVPIIRDVVELEESLAKAVILEHDSIKQKKIGYINLPSFYRDFNPRPGKPIRNCTDDVNKLLKSLNTDGVDALIFDLRNNGGGSLPDAINTAGLFFERGPVVQVKSSTGGKEVQMDRNPAISFDKPMVILQNAHSASASEIMAGALKDNGRAVVVGNKHSHGKGTVQTVIELDKHVPSIMLSKFFNFGKGKSSSLGSLKLTVSKFYRINGSSTQVKGVKPHILLPSSLDFLEEFGESELDNALAWSEVSSAKFTPWKKHKYPISKLSSSSQKRVNKNPDFKKISDRTQLLKKYANATRKNINLAKMRTEKETKEKELDDFEKAEVNKALKVTGIKANLSFLGNKASSADEKKRLTEAEKARFTEFSDKLRKDPYIEEALFIVNDILKTI